MTWARQPAHGSRRHEVGAELLDLGRLVRGLMPDRRDPEAFHLAKDEAAKRLAALARRIERGSVAA